MEIRWSLCVLSVIRFLFCSLASNAMIARSENKCAQNRRILSECQFVSEHLLYRLKFKQITEFFFAQQNASLFIDWNLMDFSGHRSRRIQRNYVVPNPILTFVECRVFVSWNAFSLTCFNSRSLFADKHVTKYLVRLKNEPSTSKVRWSREERCNINDITKNPRFCEWNRAQNTYFIQLSHSIESEWKLNCIRAGFSAYLNHMLLNRLRTLDQFTNKT